MYELQICNELMTSPTKSHLSFTKTFKICCALVVKKLDTVFSTDYISVEPVLFTRKKNVKAPVKTTIYCTDFCHICVEDL
jgi:hypothetical protein